MMQYAIKRGVDVVFSSLGLILLLPFFIIIAMFIILDSKGGVFYIQKRVGKNNIDFKLLKFRTMKPKSELQGLLTVGGKDSRVTKVGYFLRKYKIDEFPQLINVFTGKMSLVGPRPEVRKYVALYTQEQLPVLSVKPGITDFASIVYRNESELLASSESPETLYIQKIMPAKIKLNLKYIEEQSLKMDLFVIFRTIRKVFYSR